MNIKENNKIKSFWIRRFKKNNNKELLFSHISINRYGAIDIFYIETNEKNVHFVELILGIARNLNVPVIAEGVETKEHLNILKNLGCDIIQGYYFSKPLPEIEFEETILNKQTK